MVTVHVQDCTADLAPMSQLAVNSLHEHKYSYLLTPSCRYSTQVGGTGLVGQLRM